MKINFGKLKGKKLIIGDNKKMRPTQSMAKSIIFNLIEIKPNDKILDLFAGTGSLGFESVSLGAEKVYWIDTNIESFKAIKENIENFNLDVNNFKVFKTDFRMAMKKIDFKPTIIFLDPPFIAKKYYDIVLEFINKYKILDSDGVIILEKEYKNDEIKQLSNFSIYKKRKMGEKDILILKYRK